MRTFQAENFKAKAQSQPHKAGHSGTFPGSGLEEEYPYFGANRLFQGLHLPWKLPFCPGYSSAPGYKVLAVSLSHTHTGHIHSNLPPPAVEQRQLLGLHAGTKIE